jgi:excisionase family DNA binding protein
VIFVAFDSRSWAHLGAALKAHAKWCRDNAIPVPADVAELTKHAHLCATERQEATTLPSIDDPAHDPVVADVLVVTYVDAGRRIGGVSKRTVQRLVASGALPAVDIGGSPRIRVADIEAYITSLGPRNFRDTITVKSERKAG